mgnify:FL=1
MAGFGVVWSVIDSINSDGERAENQYDLPTLSRTATASDECGDVDSLSVLPQRTQLPRG